MYEVLCTQVCAATTSQQHQRLSRVRNMGHNVLKLYYQVASSQLPAHSSSPATPRTTVVLQSRQYSSCTTKSPVLIFPLPSYSAYYSCTTKSPVLKLYYQVASSHLPAPQLLRVLKLYYKVASSQLPAPQIAPRTKVVLETCQFSASSSTDCSAYQSCTTKSPVLSFQLHRLLRVLKLYYKVASSIAIYNKTAPQPTTADNSRPRNHQTL